MEQTYRLIDIFAYRCHWKMRPRFHTHSEYEIYYFHSGECQYRIGDDCLDLSPGDLIIMNGMSRHGPIMKESCIRTMVRFDESYALPFIRLPGSIDLMRPFRELRNCRWHLSDGQIAEVEAILLKMEQYHKEHGPLPFNRLRNTFVDLLLLIYECSEQALEGSKPTPVGKETSVQAVIAYIERNYMNELSMELLADHVHLSKFYMMKIFKQLTGITIFEYINKRRISQAKLLFLEDNTRTVTAISQQVGFKQITHFSRNFKQIVGMTPEQYRKFV